MDHGYRGDKSYMEDLYKDGGWARVKVLGVGFISQLG